MKVKIGLSGKKIVVNTKKLSSFGKFIGLMFKSKECGNLLFDFKEGGRGPIHSFFVFFDFLAVWLDEKDNVVDYKIVKPFCFSVNSKKDFVRLIEIPLNDKNKNLIFRFPSMHGKV